MLKGFFKNKNSFCYSENCLKNINNECIKKSIISDLNWYTKKTKEAKKYYLILSALSIILPLAVTVVNSIQDKNNIVTILAACNSFVCSWLSFRAYRISWVKYGTVAEEIKKEIRSAAAKIGEYSNVTIDIETTLFKNIEKFTEAERSSWSNYIISQKDFRASSQDENLN